jgi:hypothetical protein
LPMASPRNACAIPCSPFEAASRTTEARNRMATTTSRSSLPLPVTRPTATGGKPRGAARFPSSFTFLPPFAPRSLPASTLL